MSDTEEKISIEKIMQGLGNSLCETLPKIFKKEMGFTLTIFEFNKPSLCNYISNGNRQDMVKALKETITILENNQDDPKNKEF